MAQGGAFNVSDLIRELGLQTMSGDTMRVLETIQPTLTVGDLSEHTPPHNAPSGFWGATQGAAGGLLATIEVQSLAPGGIFIEFTTVFSAFTTVGMMVRPTGSITAAVIDPAGITSRDTPTTLVRSDDIGVVTGSRWTAVNDNLLFVFPLFIPRGQFFLMQANIPNQAITWGVGVREVPASEHSPT